MAVIFAIDRASVLAWFEATRLSVCIHQMNRVNSHFCFGRDDSTINLCECIIILLLLCITIKDVFSLLRSSSLPLIELLYWPDCKPEGPLFLAEFVCMSVCLCVSVCLWLALLPFSVNRFGWNLVARTLLWSSLAATIMAQIGRRGTTRRLFENFKKFSKSHNSNFKILIHHFCVGLSCVL